MGERSADVVNPTVFLWGLQGIVDDGVRAGHIDDMVLKFAGLKGRR